MSKEFTVVHAPQFVWLALVASISGLTGPVHAAEPLRWRLGTVVVPAEGDASTRVLAAVLRAEIAERLADQGIVPTVGGAAARTVSLRLTPVDGAGARAWELVVRARGQGAPEREQALRGDAATLVEGVRGVMAELALRVDPAMAHAPKAAALEGPLALGTLGRELAKLARQTPARATAEAVRLGARLPPGERELGLVARVLMQAAPAHAEALTRRIEAPPLRLAVLERLARERGPATAKASAAWARGLRTAYEDVLAGRVTAALAGDPGEVDFAGLDAMLARALAVTPAAPGERTRLLVWQASLALARGRLADAAAGAEAARRDLEGATARQMRGALAEVARIERASEWARESGMDVARDCLGGTPLHAAAAAGDVATIAAVGRGRADPLVRTNAFETPLHIAARQGSLPALQALLAGGGARALEARDAWGATPLLRAIRAGQGRAAWFLMLAGARPSAASDDGTNALHEAAARGLTELLPLLVRVLPLDRRDARRRSALAYAISGGSLPAVQALLAVGGPDLIEPRNITMACARGHAPWAKMLADRVGARRPELLAKALDIAARHGGLAAVACVLDTGAAPSVSAFEKGLAVTQRTAKPGPTWGRDLWALLAGRGLVATAEDPSDRDTPLHIAASFGDAALVATLARQGGRLDAVDAGGATPLHAAILAGNVETARALMAAGDPAVALYDGRTPLGLALEAGRSLELVGALVARTGDHLDAAAALGDLAMLDRVLDADPAAAARLGPEGLGAIHYAARFGQIEALARLVARGAPIALEAAPGARVEGQDLNGWTPLHLANFYDRYAAASWLVAHGAPLDAVAADGRVPQDLVRLSMTNVPRESDTGAWDVGGVSRHPPTLQSDWQTAGNDGAESVKSPPPPALAEMGSAPSVRATSLIALGGGILREERSAADEVVSGGPEDAGPAADWQSSLVRCVGESAWHEAERRARDLVAERAHPAERDPGALAAAEQNLARILLERRRFSEALAAFNRALLALRGPGIASGPRDVGAIILEGRARLHRHRGALTAAEADLRRALTLASPERRRATLGRLGTVLAEAARYREAVATLRQALGLPRATDARLPDPLRQNLAVVLGRAGDRDEARTIAYDEERRAQTWDASDEDRALTRYHAGLWHLVDGDDKEGLALVEAALRGLRALNPAHTALGRMELGLAMRLTALGRFDDADRALARAADSLTTSEGEGDLELARVETQRAALARLDTRAPSHLEDAFAHAVSAYARLVGAESPEVRWPVELELMRIELARGHQEAAVFFGRRAVRTLDAIRADVMGMGAPLARQFLDDRIAAWRELADALVTSGRLSDATMVLARLKGDELASLDVRGGGVQNAADAANGANAKKPLPAAPPSAAERSLADLTAEARRLADRELASGLSPPETDRLRALRDELSGRRRAFEAWLTALETELAAASPARARAAAAMDLRDLGAMAGTLRDLGHGAVTLHYVMGPAALRIILTTANGQIGRDAPIAAAELDRLVFRFRTALADPKSDPRPVAAELYRWLIAPVAEDLRAADAATLMVSLDGALRYVPLAALWDGEHWLIERFRIVAFARAALDKLGPPPATAATGKLAALGVARQIPGFNALPAVTAELEGIVKRDDADPDGILPGLVCLDDAFSRDRLQSLLETRGFGSVHIASHFVLEPGAETDSYLLLGDGSHLTLEDIRFALRFDGVDLLSLSACNTAVGHSATSDGREVEGFAALAMRLGARAIVATLWPVADASTGVFMRALYGVRRDDPALTKADAVRQAMLRFIRGTDTLTASDQTPRGFRPLTSTPAAAAAPTSYAHPYYWAPFVLLGNWL